jgi:hypothetical protein
MAKIVCVLYANPVDGHASSYARDSVPRIERYGRADRSHAEGHRLHAGRTAGRHLGRARPVKISGISQPHAEWRRLSAIKAAALMALSGPARPPVTGDKPARLVI